MSQPAPVLPRGRGTQPVRRAERPPSVTRTTPAGRLRLRRRRRSHALAFVVLSTILVASIVLALAALNTLIAQSSFRIDDLTDRIDALARRNLELTSEQARMSAPGRIADWARRNGMRLPDDIRFLHAHDEPSANPAGEADAVNRSAPARTGPGAAGAEDAR